MLDGKEMSYDEAIYYLERMFEESQELHAERVALGIDHD